MSGKRVVEVVELCEHDEEREHYFCDGVGYPEYDEMTHTMEECHCPGGSRRTLTEGQYVLVEDVHDLLPDAWRVLNATAAFGHPGGSGALWKDLRAALRGDPIPSLGALSDHTEGTL